METNEDKRNINEEAEISAAFQELLDTYLSTQHRRKVEIITKAFNFTRKHEILSPFSNNHSMLFPFIF